MSQAGKLVKGLVKAKKESVMGKLGDSPFEDPMDQWSVKYNAPVTNEETEQLSEDGWLFKYIRSLGYNPEVMPFATRAKYARTTAFKHYKQSHSQDGSKTDGIVAKEEVNESRPYMTVGGVRKRENDEGHGRTTTKTVVQHNVHINGKHWKAFSNEGEANRAAASVQRKYPEKRVRVSPQTFYHKVTEEVESLDEAGTGVLMHFIKMKGLNPLTMDGNQKHAYARSSEFKIFKMRHEQKLKETSGMGERGEDWNEEKETVKEGVDKRDTVTMDIPLLIRVLEYAREDAKTDMDLHKVVENLIAMRGRGTLSMKMYNRIVAIKEELERIDELSNDLLGRYKTAAGAQASAADKAGDYAKGNKRFSGIMKATRKQFDNDAKKVNELKKMPDNMDTDDHITREMKDPCWKGYNMVGTKKKGGKTVPNCVPVQEGIGGIEDSPLSATNSVKAMESAHRKGQMKSARMIKSLYKNKLKETMYDWEKDDKPKAKIVVKGGTTMTGQPRDTVEIEPVLKSRPNSAKPTN